MNETRSRVQNIARVGDRISQGLVRFDRPCPSSSPHDGVGAGSPKPRKSSDTSAPISATTAKGANEMTGVSAFGRMCLKMIAPSVQPMARAAAT